MTPTRPQPRYEDLELRMEREYEPEPVRRESKLYAGCAYIVLLLVVVLWRWGR